MSTLKDTVPKRFTRVTQSVPRHKGPYAHKKKPSQAKGEQTVPQRHSHRIQSVGTSSKAATSTHVDLTAESGDEQHSVKKKA